MLKIAPTFFDSTSRAAVSARALSLRRNSRSSILDALPVLLGRLRAGPRFLGRGQRLRGRQPPAGQILREDPVGSAPGALAGLVHRSRGQHRVEPGRRCPGPPSGGPGQRITAPALQGVRSNTNLTRHDFHRCALRRQQPCYRSVLECLSVSRHLVLPSSPPVRRFYRGDNYSDAGGCCYRRLRWMSGLSRFAALQIGPVSGRGNRLMTVSVSSPAPSR